MRFIVLTACKGSTYITLKQLLTIRLLQYSLQRA
jgi:hypothetical protein